ncbi:hypothetical protein Mapa_001340 [Marchantia paleacea]|nr:hypothetical protein Mapa_001340 [Marchantia paleacea]
MKKNKIGVSQKHFVTTINMTQFYQQTVFMTSFFNITSKMCRIQQHIQLPIGI